MRTVRFGRNTHFCREMGYVANTRFFGIVLTQICLRKMRFDSDFTQTSGQKMVNEASGHLRYPTLQKEREYASSAIYLLKALNQYHTAVFMYHVSRLQKFLNQRNPQTNSNSMHSILSDDNYRQTGYVICHTLRRNLKNNCENVVLASPPVQQGPLLHLHLYFHLDSHLVVRGERNTLITSSHTHIDTFVKIQKSGPGLNQYLKGTMESQVRLLDLIS